MDSPKSSLEETKARMCLSPQDKLKSASALLAAQRSSSSSKKAAQDIDAESAWISDDNLRAMGLDDRLNQDIDWVDVQENDGGALALSLAMDFEHDGGDQDVVGDFGFASYLSPLRGRLVTFEDASEVAPSFECAGMDLAECSATDAEKLLMSFDTMNFTIPSPTSSSSKKRRASLFGKPEQSKIARSAAATSTGSMSPSLKLKVSSARGLSPEELLKDASKPSLSTAPADPLLGVLSITIPTSEPVAGAETGRKIGSYSPAARKLRIQKFHEKRKNRTWKKSIKYDCRKKLADDRPRIKGRFVRVLESMGDAKDDEPLTPTAPMSPVSFSSFTPPVTPISSPDSLSPSSLSPMSPASFAAAVGMVMVPAPTSFSLEAPETAAAAAAAAELPVHLLATPAPVQAALSASSAAIAPLVASTS